MRLDFNFLTIVLIGTVSAVPKPQGGSAGAPVAGAIGDITTALVGLKGKVNGLTGDAVQASNVLLDAKSLQTTITTSTKKISAMQMLPLSEAVNVLQPANQLIKEAQGTVDGLIAKKSVLDKAQLSSVVKTTLTQIKTDADGMVVAVKKILPDNVKTVGDSIGKQIDATLDKGIKAYS